MGTFFLLDDLIDQVSNWKKENKIIGFTNGCFDILHLGHISSLRQTKEHCDILIVGSNSDASIKRLKGNDRPINDELSRCEFLSELISVDAIVIFDDDTALPLIKEIKPDVICKEGYTIDKWPEAQYVLSYGGKVVFLKRIDGHSTTEIVRKIKT